jgi:hypothetical protein
MWVILLRFTYKVAITSCLTQLFATDKAITAMCVKTEISVLTIHYVYSLGNFLAT